ncbi:MAG TPA: hypothetical protein VIQ77_09230 [Mucilaginibacter sp.]|jgi:hypothetical protein
MKITFKALVYAVAFTCFFSAAKAQIIIPDSVRIGLGASIASTNGNNFGVAVNKAIGDDAKSAYNFGAGLALNVDVPIFSSMYITASAGYMSFFKTANASKSQQAIAGINTPNFNTIPLKLGYKFIIGNRFYVNAEAGETLLANKKALYAMYGNAFTWSPSIGLLMPFTKHHHQYIDASLRYESTQTFYNDNNLNNFWALRVTYAFNL